MNSFHTFPLSETNTLNGQIFSELNLQVLQNERSQIAEQILALTYDPADPVKFAQDDAFLKGQLQFIAFLIERSEESKQALLAAALNSQQINP